MTGEITLRGEVLAVGGLREKLSAAARLRIKHVILPAVNAHEVERLRPEVRRRLEIHPIEHADEALRIALRLDRS